MPEPSSPFAQPMAWWGAIQSSVRARATTAEVWQAIRDFGQANDLAYPPGMFQAVNQMRTLAGGLRNASERLGRAAPGDAITSAVLAPLPYARPASARGAVPQYHVRVQYTAEKGGAVDTGYVTLPYTGSLPATVGELYADAQLVTESLVAGYDAELLSLGAIEIGEW